MSDSRALELKITETSAGIQFKVHVQPRSSRNQICGAHGGEIKLRLTAPPVEDAANRLCVEFLADRLGVAKSRVTITSGTKSRHKTIRVEGIGADTIVSILKVTDEE